MPARSRGQGRSPRGSPPVRRALTPASTALTLRDRRPRADLQEDTIVGNEGDLQEGTASA
jgi:hypothetical protein